MFHLQHKSQITMPTGVAKPIGNSCVVPILIRSYWYLWQEYGREEVNSSGQWAGQTSQAKLWLNLRIDGLLPLPQAREKRVKGVATLWPENINFTGKKTTMNAMDVNILDCALCSWRGVSERQLQPRKLVPMQHWKCYAMERVKP